MTGFKIALFSFQLIILFFVSRSTTILIWKYIYRITRNKQTANIALSLFFFPGTALHEIAHLLSCFALGLKVNHVRLFPEFKENGIKLGTVTYGKKDVVRSIIVGISPLIFGLSILWFIAVFQLFPSSSIFMSIIFGYIIFNVSSTMFSSKQDLVDFAYILPLGIVCAIVVYVFDIRLDVLFHNRTMQNAFLDIMTKLNVFLLISFFIHISIIIVLKTFDFLSRKK